MAAVPLTVTSTKKKGKYEIKTYNVEKLRSMGQGKTLGKMIMLLGSVGAPMDMQDDGTALGYFGGTDKFRVAFEDGKVVAIHMKGETEDYPEGEKFNKKFGKKGVFGKSGGSSLNIEGGRTKRHRGGRKHRKTRKLTTRRR